MAGPSQKNRQPFDQRFLTFLMMSFAVLMLWNVWFAPPPPVKPADGGDEAAAQLAEGKEPAADALAAKPDASADTDAADEGKNGDPKADAAKIADEAAVESQAVQLGSIDPDSPYRMLMTLTNRGAAVERIELASEKYRDLDNRGGYLGELGLEEVDPGKGVRITTVGPGTPAAEAGLQVGDVLLGAERASAKSGNKGTIDFANLQAFENWLSKTKPKQKYNLTIERNSQAATTQTVRLVRRPLALLRPESENLLLHREKLPKDFQDVTSFRLIIEQLGELTNDDGIIAAASDALANETWTVSESSETQVVFAKRLPKLELEFVKRYELVKVPANKQSDADFAAYHFNLEIEVNNLASEPQDVAYKLEGPNGLPIEGWWYSNKVGRGWGRYGIRDIITRFNNGSPQQFACSEVVRDDVEPMGQGASLAYIGVDAQYFAVALVPRKETLDEVWLEVAEAKLATAKLLDRTDSDKPDVIFNNPTFTVTREAITLAAGESLKDAFVIFAGPKRPGLLANYAPAGNQNYTLVDFSYLGWFAPVAKIMLGILHTFYAVVRNYGIAIILLTVLVRGAMFPLSRKQAANMVMMQQLKPEMDRIAAKHKDDREKQMKAQQDLFRKHNYNPMGGCLLMFLQLPIFIGLYRALAVDVELRQAPLISDSIRWCSNLGAPDMLYDWSAIMPRWVENGQGIFALGPYFNILPVATVCLFLLQQKMFMPEATSEQAIMQQKMMKYMMGFMGLMFFKVASGLCLYFIASSLWGIAERKLLPKPPAADTVDTGFSKPSLPKDSSAKRSSNKNGGGKNKSGKKKKR